MQESSVPPAPTPSPKFTVLIADDDDIGRKGLFRLLSREGYQCVEAKSGDEAQQALQTGGIDLVLADIKMQGNSELELLKHLQATQSRIPVILMTGYPTVETAVAATSFSASAYLLKPIDPPKLIAAVRKEFDRRRTLFAIQQSLQRQENNVNAMREMQAALGHSSRNIESDLVSCYAGMAFENAIDTLLELKELLKPVLARNRSEMEAYFSQSRPALLISSIQEAIQIIDQTKHSFKSKELASLRQKLESVLKEN